MHAAQVQQINCKESVARFGQGKVMDSNRLNFAVMASLATLLQMATSSYSTDTIVSYSLCGISVESNLVI